MKPLNFNGKILLIPMAQLPRQTQDALRQEDGMQALGGANLFVYATGRVVSGCCCGHHHGGEHHHEDGHECCGGGHHHEDGHECCGGGHHHEDGHECCGGGHHHEDGHECCGGGHHHEDGHECCGGGHHHEDGHECCGGGHHHEDGHECCGGGHHHEDGHECCGGGHHHETPYNADEADETYFASEDLAYGKEDPVTETIDDHLLLVVNEPVVIVNTSDAERIGFDAQQARWFELPPDGVTLVPGRDVDKGFFQTGPISIQLRD